MPPKKEATPSVEPRGVRDGPLTSREGAVVLQRAATVAEEESAQAYATLTGVTGPENPLFKAIKFKTLFEFY